MELNLFIPLAYTRAKLVELISPILVAASYLKEAAFFILSMVLACVGGPNSARVKFE